MSELVVSKALPASSLTIEPQTIDAARLGFASLSVEELRKATHRLSEQPPAHPIDRWAVPVH